MHFTSVSSSLLQSGPCSVALSAAHLTCVRAHKGWLVRTNLLLHMRGPGSALALFTPLHNTFDFTLSAAGHSCRLLVTAGWCLRMTPVFLSALLRVPVLTADCTLGSPGRAAAADSVPHSGWPGWSWARLGRVRHSSTRAATHHTSPIIRPTSLNIIHCTWSAINHQPGASLGL